MTDAMNPVRTVDVRASHSRLLAWLLTAPLQVTEGREAGGVAGVVSADRGIRYVYAEITGYYLHWLASPGVRARPEASQRAAASLAWVLRAYAARTPPARIHLDGTSGDWRNATRFVFDLGMVAGGVAAAWSCGLIPPAPALASELQAQATAFIDPAGRMDATAPAVDIARWSTRPGPFLAKPASRLEMLARLHVPAPVLVMACRRALAAAAPNAEPGHVELHPALYHLEGVACTGDDPRAAVAPTLARILAFENGAGALPETPGSNLLRTDVTAQALRLALWAGAPAADPRLARMAQALARAVDPAGGIGFALGVDSTDRNVWCAMFAEQALRAWLHAQAHGAPGLEAHDIV